MMEWLFFLWRIEEYVGVEISWHRFKFFYPSHLKLFASPPFRLKLVFSHFSTQSLVTQLWTLQHPTLRCWFGRVFSDIVHLSQRHQRRWRCWRWVCCWWSSTMTATTLSTVALSSSSSRGRRFETTSVALSTFTLERSLDFLSSGGL